MGAIGWMGRMLAPVRRTLTPAARLVLGLALTSILLAVLFGWREFGYLGAVLVAAVLLCLPFLFLGLPYAVVLRFDRRRVVVGQPLTGRLIVRNAGRRASGAGGIDIRMAGGAVAIPVPPLRPGQTHEELVPVPTDRRGPILAGPAQSLRGDPLGMLRRRLDWGRGAELLVHPRTVRLGGLAVGLVRDLDGRSSTRITDTDLAFHSLRPYVPGDDRRNVHWRTSARIGRLMVRQFEENGRTRLTMIQATRRDLYDSDEEFELAVSVTASIAAQAIRDGLGLGLMSESGPWPVATVTAMLDASCRIEAAPERSPSLRELAGRAALLLPSPDVVVVVGGSGLTAEGSAVFGRDVRRIVVRVVEGGRAAAASAGGVTQLTVGRLDDLPRLLGGPDR